MEILREIEGKIPVTHDMSYNECKQLSKMSDSVMEVIYTSFRYGFALGMRYGNDEEGK